MLLKQHMLLTFPVVQLVILDGDADMTQGLCNNLVRDPLLSQSACRRLPKRCPFYVLVFSMYHLVHLFLKELQTFMELQVGGVDDDHVGKAGEGEVVEGGHVEQLSNIS